MIDVSTAHRTTIEGVKSLVQDYFVVMHNKLALLWKKLLNSHFRTYPW